MLNQATGNFKVKELFQEIIHELESGETVAVATIVKRKGSVPREVGQCCPGRRTGSCAG